MFFSLEICLFVYIWLFFLPKTSSAVLFFLSLNSRPAKTLARSRRSKAHAGSVWRDVIASFPSSSFSFFLSLFFLKITSTARPRTSTDSWRRRKKKKQKEREERMKSTSTTGKGYLIPSSISFLFLWLEEGNLLPFPLAIAEEERRVSTIWRLW